MTGQVSLVDEEVVIRVQLPELAVDDVEVFVGEELGQLVDVVHLVQQGHVLRPSERKKERHTFQPRLFLPLSMSLASVETEQNALLIQRTLSRF